MKAGGFQLKVLHVTHIYPTQKEPHYGSFIKNQIDSLKKYLPETKISVYVIKGRGILRYIPAIPPLVRILNQDWDIIHCHYGNVGSLVKVLSLNRRPIVTSYCGTDVLGGVGNLSLWKIKTMISGKVNKLFSTYDKVSIAKSENIAKCFSQKEKVMVIPNGVNTEVFRPIERSEAIKELNLDPNLKYVLFPADPKREVKNYSYILNNGLVPNKCKLLTFQNKVKNTRVPYYMAAANVILFPSKQEGSPNVIKEAMACNRPIISADVGDVKKTISMVENTYVLNLKDVEKWRYAVAALLEKYMVTNGREHLCKLGLTEKKVAFRLHDVYKRVVKKELPQTSMVNL